MVRFRNASHVRADGNLVHVFEAERQKGGFYFPRRSLGAELSDYSGSDRRNNLVTLFYCLNKLKYLRLVRNGAERTCRHTLTACNALFIVDMSPAVFVRGNGFYPASGGAGTHVVCDCVVRACGFASAALYTFTLVDKRFSVHNGNSAFGTAFYARVRNAVAALVGNVIFVVGAFVARRRYDLH
jgi:hypothetical protein